MTEPQPIAEAIAEAVNGSDYLAMLDDSLDDIGEEDPAGDPAAGEGTSSTGDGPDVEQQSENSLEGVTDEELPDVYWGTSLEGLSAEQKRSVISALEQRDSTIQQLQAKLAKAPEPVVTDPALDEKEEITDDDILRAIGIDPEGDPFEIEQARKTTLPLAKQIIQLEEQVEKLSNTETVREVGNQWNSALDGLEAQFGKLPGDRLQVLQYAADEGISNPEVLYFRLTAPSRKAVEAEITKVRQNEAKKAAAGGVRPRSVDGGSTVFDDKGLSLRDTVKKAALDAQRETGKRWRDVLRPNQ
jgi:hypothetical protein